MDLLHNIGLGFSVAALPQNLFFCFIGVLLGTLIGVLPGIGPLATIAMLLPITLRRCRPTTALIMLAGIYYGAQYGGSTTAILVNMPGEVVLGRHRARRLPDGATGPRPARRWRSRRSARSSPARVATLLIAVFGPPLAEVALQVRAGRIFLADGARPGRPVVLAQRLAVSRRIAMIVLGPARSAWSAPTSTGAAALHLRRAGTVRRHRLRGGGDGPVRHRRDHAQPRGPSRARRRSRRVRSLLPTAAGHAAIASARSCAAPRSARCSASCPAAARCCLVRRLHAGEEDRRSDPSASARARSRASRGRSRPTTPARRHRSSRC